jgi:predicted PurR-regulated permease PerM
MTVFAFLPLVGITIVILPAFAVLLVRGDASTALIFLTFCLVMGTFVDNVVKTKLMGSAMRMHDLLVFLSIIGGLGAFGVIGFIYGPLIAMLFITLHGLYESHYLPQIAHTFRGRRALREL